MSGNVPLPTQNQASLGPAPGPGNIPPVQALPSPRPLKMVADAVRNGGYLSAATVAAIWHPANLPGSGVARVSQVQLFQRIVKAYAHFGQNFNQFHQGTPHAIALRLLAPAAGPEYTFEQVATTYTNANNEPVSGFKCGAPNCDFHGKDRSRHMQTAHVKDIDKAICCPYEGCEDIKYRSEASSVQPHLDQHVGRHDTLSA